MTLPLPSEDQAARDLQLTPVQQTEIRRGNLRFGPQGLETAPQSFGPARPRPVVPLPASPQIASQLFPGLAGFPGAETLPPMPVDDRRRILAWQMMMLEPSLSPTELNKAVDLIWNAGPELVARAANDPELAFSQALEENLLRRIDKLGDGFWSQIFEPLATAVLDQVTERRSGVMATRHIWEDPLAFGGTWGRATSLDRETIFAALDQEDRPTQGPIFLWPQKAKDAYFASKRFDYRPGEYRWDGGTNLVLRVQSREGEPPDEVRILLKPGTVIRNEFDAMLAYAKAAAGDDHIIDPASGDLPGRQTILGQALEGTENMMLAVQDAVGWLGNTVGFNNFDAAGFRTIARQIETRPPTPEEAHTETLLTAAREGQLTSQDSARLFMYRSGGFDALKELDRTLKQRETFDNFWTPDRTATFAVASTVEALDRRYGAGTIQLAMQASESLDLQEMGRDLATVNYEAAIARQKQTVDDMSLIHRALNEYVLNPVLVMAETWDNFIQSTLVDVTAGVTAAAATIADTDLLAARDNFVEHFDNIKGDSETVADLFGVEGTAATWLNFMTSAIFDPINYVTPGGRAFLKWGRHILTDPAKAMQAIRHPRIYNMADRALAEGGDTAFRNMMALADNLSSDTYEVILRHIETGSTKGLGLRARAARVNALLDDLAQSGPAFGGTTVINWGGRLAQRHDRGLLANLAGNFAGMDESERLLVSSLFVRADRDALFELHSGTFVDDVARHAGWLYGPGSDDYFRWVRSATERYRDSKVGWARMVTAKEADRAVLAQEIEAITERYGDAFRVMESRAGADSLMGDIEKARREVARLETAGRRGEEVFDTATARLRSLTDEWAAALRGGTFSPGMGEAEVLTNYRRLLSLQRDSQQLDFDLIRLARDDTFGFEELIHSMYQQKGEALGLAETSTAHPVLAGKKTLAWNQTRLGKTGDPEMYAKAQRLARGEIRVEGTVGGKPVSKVVEQIQDFNLFDNRIATALPVAPLHLIAYEATREAPAVWAAMARVATRSRAISKMMHGMSDVFALNLLLNPLTSIRASLDEVARMLNVGIGPLKTFKTVFAGFKRQPFKEASSRAVAAERLVEHGFGGTSQGWRMLRRGEHTAKSVEDAAERFINGTIGQSDGMRTYARAVREGDFGIFEEWWRTEGILGSNRLQVTREGFKVLTTAEEAYEAIGDYLKAVSMLAKEEHQPAVLGRLIDNLAADKPWFRRPPKGMPKNASDGFYLRQFRSAPGQIFDLSATSKLGRARDWAMDVGYTRPSAHRFHVIFDYYYDFIKSIYRDVTFDPATGKGTLKILTPRMLADELGMELDDAKVLLRKAGRDPTVSQYLQGGWHLEDEVDQAARRYASRQADNLMYRLTATSIAGQAGRLVFPFGRAHIDFWQYWLSKMLEPTAIRTSPFKARFATPALRVGAKKVPLIPFNARLAAKAAHFVANVREDPNIPRSQQNRAAPSSITEAFTFLPTRFDPEGIMVDIVPGLGPIPVGLALMLNESGAVTLDDSWLTDIFVPLQWQMESFGDDLSRGLSEVLLPVGGRSLRRLVGALGQMGVSQLPSSTLTRAADKGLSWVMAQAATPPGGPDEILNAAVGFFKDDVFDHAVSERETSPFYTQMSTLIDRGLRQAYVDQAVTVAASHLGLNAAYASDRPLAPLVMDPDVISDLSNMAADGILPIDLVDSFTIAVSAVGDDPAHVRLSPEKIPRLDKVIDAFWLLVDEMDRGQFQRLLVDHPELNLLTVAKDEVVRDSQDNPIMPKDLWQFIDGDRFRPPNTADGRNQRQEARRKGWVTPRSGHVMLHDAAVNAHEAARGYIRDLWFTLTEPAEVTVWREPSQSKGAKTLNVTLSAADEQRLRTLGVDMNQFRLGGGYRMSVADLYGELKRSRDRFGFQQYDDSALRPTLARLDDTNVQPLPSDLVGVAQSHGWALGDQHVADIGLFGTSILDDFAVVRRKLEDAGITEFEDWPSDLVDYFRNRLKVAVALNPEFTAQDYNEFFRPFLGDLGFEFQPPPRLEDVSKTEGGLVWRTEPDRIAVLDGDTLTVQTATEPVYVRLVGINAPERHEDGYNQATENLKDLIGRAGAVHLVVFDPQLYGTVQTRFEQTAEGIVERQRMLVWLYVDGVPVFSPDEFTWDNPRAATQGGKVYDLENLWRINREEYGLMPEGEPA